MVSEYKKKQMKYSAVIGAIVGVAIFGVMYSMIPSLVYLIFIPIASMMAAATYYMKEENK